jgi:hypothetical protein
VIDMPHARPIWGFGWIGWIACGALAALLAMVLAGVDFTILYVNFIHDLFGLKFLFWFLVSVHAGHCFTILGPTFGLIGLCIVVVALFIHLPRHGWWRCAPLIVWALIHPAMYRAEMHMTQWIGTMITGVQISEVEAIEFDGMIFESVTCALLFLVTGSWVVLLATFFLMLASQQVDNVLGAFPPFGGHSAVVLWNAGLAVILLWWAIQARRRVFGPGRCAACGYDLRGVAHERCPECGEAVTIPAARPA